MSKTVQQHNQVNLTTEITPEDLDRDEIEFGDGDEGRIYYDDNLEVVFPSVTTVTNQRVDPEKEAALQGWRDRYDGSSEYCSPHHKEQMKYKGWRGTLAHWNCLSPLGDISAGSDNYYDDLGDNDKGFEEYWAEYKLQTYGKYDGDDAYDKALREIHWVYKKFTEEVAPDLGITDSSVIDVERYVLDTDYRYSGQFDLLYEDYNGNVVLSDLKTSSGIREDYKLQVAAYAKALEKEMDITVDKTEVIRIYPDRKEVDIQDNTDWNRTIDSYYEQFLGLVYKTLNYVPEDYFDD